MIYFKFLIAISSLVISSTSIAELTQLADEQLQQVDGQNGIGFDQSMLLSAKDIQMDLNGSDALAIISGNRRDADHSNDALLWNTSFSGLHLDVLESGKLSISLPQQLTIGLRDSQTGLLEQGIYLELYASKTTEIRETQYRNQAQTYTAYVNTISSDPEFDDFTLSISGAQFSNNSQQYRARYIENQSNSNIDGAAISFTVTNPGEVSLSLVSDDGRCGFFQGGCDRGEIIIVDEQGDLVGRAGSPDQANTQLNNLAVAPRRVVDQPGSNFYISAELTGSFDFTGSLQVFSGTEVERRY